MSTLLDFATDEQIQQEYKKTFLLNMFRKICVKMKKDAAYKTHLQTLYRESFNNKITTQLIVKKAFNYDLTMDEANTMNMWIEAHLKKSNKRKSIPHSVKSNLYEKQDGKCAACGENLGDDWSKIHVDHIIPWTLVGDEIEDNYQALCETCNECKSASTDYIFKSLIKLI